MHRRKYLATISTTASTLSIAGCSGDSGSGLGSLGDCTITQSGDEVEPVSVTFDGRLDSATVELDLRWSAATVNDASQFSPSDEDEKYIFFVFEIENTTDTTVPIIHTSGYYLFMLDFETPDTTGEEIPTQVSGQDQLMSETVDLKSGEKFRSQVIFSVSDDVTQATVKLSENPYIADATRDSDEIPAFNPECVRDGNTEESTSEGGTEESTTEGGTEESTSEGGTEESTSEGDTEEETPTETPTETPEPLIITGFEPRIEEEPFEDYYSLTYIITVENGNGREFEFEPEFEYPSGESISQSKSDNANLGQLDGIEISEIWSTDLDKSEIQTKFENSTHRLYVDGQQVFEGSCDQSQEYYTGFNCEFDVYEEVESENR